MSKANSLSKNFPFPGEPPQLSDHLLRKVVKAIEQSHSLRITECLAQELITSAGQLESLQSKNQVSNSNVEALMQALSRKLVGAPLRNYGSREQIRDFYERFAMAAKANGIELISATLAE